MSVTAPDPRRLWLLSRVDKRCVDAIDELLRDITEHLAIATADSVSVRVLSADGQSLLPLNAYHPDPQHGAAMAAIMGETTQPSTSGLWRSVIETRQPRRWRIPPGHVPPEASQPQAAFLERFPIRAVLAVPLLVDGQVVGGVSLVRFSVDREFTDHDEALLAACADRIAPALDFRSKLAEMSPEIR